MFASGAMPTQDAPTLLWLDDACAALENADARLESQAAGITRTLRFRAHNVGRWAGQTAELDLATLDGQVQLAGRNGAGKTTIMAWRGPAMGFGECANRGSAAAYALMGESWVETEFEAGGHVFRSRVEMTRRLISRGANKGKEDSTPPRGFLWRDGVPYVAGKITSFYETIASFVHGPDHRFYITAYHAQRTAELNTKAPVSFGESHPKDRDQLFRASPPPGGPPGAQRATGAR
jgi:hypothetical protein